MVTASSSSSLSTMLEGAGPGGVTGGGGGGWTTETKKKSKEVNQGKHSGMRWIPQQVERQSSSEVFESLLPIVLGDEAGGSLIGCFSETMISRRGWFPVVISCRADRLRWPRIPQGS